MPVTFAKPPLPPSLSDPFPRARAHVVPSTPSPGKRRLLHAVHVHAGPALQVFGQRSWSWTKHHGEERDGGDEQPSLHAHACIPTSTCGQEGRIRTIFCYVPLDESGLVLGFSVSTVVVFERGSDPLGHGKTLEFFRIPDVNSALFQVDDFVDAPAVRSCPLVVISKRGGPSS